MNLKDVTEQQGTRQVRSKLDELVQGSYQSLQVVLNIYIVSTLATN